jgi:hypothetical protein
MAIDGARVGTPPARSERELTEGQIEECCPAVVELGNGRAIIQRNKPGDRILMMICIWPHILLISST